MIMASMAREPADMYTIKQAFDESQKSKSEAGSAHHPKKSEPKIPLSKDGYIAMAIYYAPFLLGIIAIVVILHLMGA